MPAIAPIARKNLVEVVEERLREFIRAEKMRPGDVLPGELSLAEKLAVSRNIVREALSRLRMLGMLDSRKKRGLVVSTPDPFAGFQRVLDTRLLDESAMRDLSSLRLMLEVGMADFVCTRVTDDDLDALDSLLALEDDAIQSRMEKERIDCDIAFHSRLYRISGNAMLQRFQEMLPGFFKITQSPEKAAERVAAVCSHRGVLEALRARNPQAFREAMSFHLAPAIKSMMK